MTEKSIVPAAIRLGQFVEYNGVLDEATDCDLFFWVDRFDKIKREDLLMLDIFIVFCEEL